MIIPVKPLISLPSPDKKIISVPDFLHVDPTGLGRGETFVPVI